MKKKYYILFALSVVLIVLDQWTKVMIRNHFYLGESIDIISGFFNLTYVQNKGAAFGILANANPSFRVPFFIIIPIIALISIFFVFKKVPDHNRKVSLALTLVISGAIGNLMDRLYLGYVVDFLDFHWKWNYHYPAFNIADSAICVGVGILMLDILMSTKDLDQPIRKKN